MEEWYPGYSSSWVPLRGAIGNLYEQASIVTDAVRREEGTLETYREEVLAGAFPGPEHSYGMSDEALQALLAELADESND